MNLDLLPDDLIEIINKKLIELQNKERRKIRKETKRTAKQYKFCEKLLKKACSKYDNILDYEFCIGGEITRNSFVSLVFLFFLFCFYFLWSWHI